MKYHHVYDYELSDYELFDYELCDSFSIVISPGYLLFNKSMIFFCFILFILGSSKCLN